MVLVLLVVVSLWVSLTATSLGPLVLGVLSTLLSALLTVVLVASLGGPPVAVPSAAWVAVLSVLVVLAPALATLPAAVGASVALLVPLRVGSFAHVPELPIPLGVLATLLAPPVGPVAPLAVGRTDAALRVFRLRVGPL